MPRLLGVDIPNDRPVVVALTYLYGVGPKTARTLCHDAGIDPHARARDLREDELEIHQLHENTWYHVAVTWDFTEQPHQIALFVNGTELSRTGHKGQDFGIFENFRFGAHRHNFQAVGSANGVLDEIMGYTRVLTNEEIEQLSTGDNPEDGLFFHFTFDE